MLYVAGDTWRAGGRPKKGNNVLIDYVIGHRYYRCGFVENILHQNHLNFYMYLIHGSFMTDGVIASSWRRLLSWFQVSDVMNSAPWSDLLSRPAHGKTPALGISWSNMLIVRLMMSRTGQSVVLPLDETRAQNCDRALNSSPCDLAVRTYEATVRAIEVIFAPHLPNSVCQIILDREGVKGRAWIS